MWPRPARPNTSNNRRRSFLGAVLASSLAAFVVIPVGTSYADPVPVSAQPLNGWDVNGPVYAVKIVGNTVYVGGQFTLARPPSGATQPRVNLAAFSLSTGALLPFRADTNAPVRALEASGSSVYVGGEFTSIAGVAKSRLASVNATSGAVNTGFTSNASGKVNSLDVSTLLYVGGAFNTIGGHTTVPRLAAVNLTSGAVNPGFDPKPNNSIRGLVVFGTRVYAGGNFTQIAGVARAHIAGVSTVDGSIQGGNFSPTAGGRGIDVDVSPDGLTLFGALGDKANRVVAWNTATGAQRWKQTTRGDTQAVKYFGGNVYFGFHDGFGADTTLKMLASDAVTGHVEAFKPVFNKFFGVWDIDATAAAVVAGGDFTTVQTVPTSGIAIFQ